MVPYHHVRSATVLSFEILGQYVRVACEDASLARVVLANYGTLTATPGREPDLEYFLTGDAECNTLVLARSQRPEVAASGLGELLFCLEKDVTVALQEKRSDLLFLHAAAIEHGGRAYLLAGDSGNGKSTTAWGLLHHGFRYLSDELSPIDVGSRSVFAYAHALCLKRPVPSAYDLPATGILEFPSTIHVPASLLPTPTAPEPYEVGAVFFVCHRKDLHAPALRAIGAAEAAARLYVSALNALAHPSLGLDAVVALAERTPCYTLLSADLRLTCDAVCRTVPGA